MKFSGRPLAFARFCRQRVEDPPPDAAPGPSVEAIVGRRVWPVALRQTPPRHPCAQHVEDGVHDFAVVTPCALPSFRHQRLEKFPFLVAQLESHDPPPPTVNHLRPLFSGTDSKRITYFPS